MWTSRCKGSAMSNQSPEPNHPPMSDLHRRILAAFTLAFGEPTRSMGKDMHWGLRTAPRLPHINVLVNGSSERPIVWVFDPHDHDDGVHHEAIMDDESIARLTAQIQRRVAEASRSA
jgi:hypothetical protein